MYQRSRVIQDARPLLLNFPSAPRLPSLRSLATPIPNSSFNPLTHKRASSDVQPTPIGIAPYRYRDAAIWIAATLRQLEHVELKPSVHRFLLTGHQIDVGISDIVQPGGAGLGELETAFSVFGYATRASLLQQQLKEHNDVADVYVYENRHKDDKRYVNRVLKDKSHLSYDWRVPLNLLKETWQTDPKPRLSIRYRAVNDNEENHSAGPASRAAKASAHISAEFITVPETWSTYNLIGYVRRLIRSRITGSLHYRAYGAGRTHVQMVTSILWRLFQNEALRSYLSVPIFEEAMQYFYRYQLVSDARNLFHLMEDLGMATGPEIFNMQLRHSAGIKDLHNFTYILQNMIERGISPNEITWRSLIMAIESKEVRAIIVQNMLERGMLQPSGFKRNVVQLLARDEVIDHLERSQIWDGFFEYMDNQYGHNWVSTSAVNNILDEVGRRQSISDSLYVLHHLRAYKWTPDHVTFSTMLEICLFKKSFHAAVEIVETFENYFNKQPGRQELQTLFKLAWQKRKYNFARVVWQAACLQDSVTTEMKVIVATSLRDYDPSAHVAETSSRTSGDVFQVSAGRFVLGLRQNHFSGLQKRPDQLEEVSKRSHAIVKDAIKQDLDSGARYQLAERFSVLIRKALVRDREWEVSISARRRSVLWKLENAVPIPILSRFEEGAKAAQTSVARYDMGNEVLHSRRLILKPQDVASRQLSRFRFNADDSVRRRGRKDALRADRGKGGMRKKLKRLNLPEQ